MNPAMAPNQALYQRVRSLLPRQREALARQLGVAPPSSSQSPQKLVAYVVLKEDKPQPADLRHTLAAKLPNYMVPAAIVSLEAMPRNANGKVDVQALPAPQLTPPSVSATPRTPAEASLVQIWSSVLGLDSVGIHDNFFELGGDSILSIQIVSQAREAGLRLAPNQLFERPTIAELAAAANLSPEAVISQDEVTGVVPLTPIQHWFLQQGMAAPYHWHQARLIELPEGVDLEAVERAISTLWSHHDALRLSFYPTETGWQQHNQDSAQPPALQVVDIAGQNQAEQIEAVSQHGDAFYRKTDPAGLMQVAYFQRDPHQPNWLLLGLHHWVIDAISWQILLEDLTRVLTTADDLPAKTTAFKTWAEALPHHLPTEEIAFWRSQVEEPGISLSRDFESASMTEAATCTLTVALDSADTQALLQSVPAAYNTQINDALLTALAQMLLQSAGEATGSVRVEVEAHGREHIVPQSDLSRTIGWFTTTYPVRLTLSEINSTAALKSVKEQLRQIPKRGIGYGLLRYLGDEATRAQLAQSSPEILFNYLGQQGATRPPLVREDIHLGCLRHPQNARGYPLEINAWVADSQLQVNWAYDTGAYRSETIGDLAHCYIRNLKTLIADCTNNSGGFTPSDFPDADLDQSELDSFIGQLMQEAL